GANGRPVTVRVTDATIDSPAFHVDVPDAVIVWSPAVSSASTRYDEATKTWVTMVPVDVRGNVMVSGAALPMADGLPGGVKGVKWRAHFRTDTPGVSVQWKWGAAVYSNLGDGYASFDVKPVDAAKLSQYDNHDRAGT